MRSALRGLGPLAFTLAVVGVFVACGWVFGTSMVRTVHSTKLPWIVARATGLGAFVALTALVVIGLRFRHPPREGRRRVHPEMLLRFHAALGPAVVTLVAAHVVSLLEDRWSGVTPRSVVVPFVAHYRPGPVGAGTIAAELLAVITATAALAGRPGVRARWAPMHRLAYPTFALAWVHGVLAGSDSVTLRSLYVAAGLAVGLAALPAVTRWATLGDRAGRGRHRPVAQR